MKSKNLRVSCCVAALIAMSASAQAQTMSAASTPPPPSEWDQWVKQTKNPTDWLTWGADLRIRNEYFGNVLTVNETAPQHDTDVIRYRGRLWASVMPITNLSFNVRLAAEPREWMKPAGFGPYGSAAVTPPGSTPREGMEWRYGIFDNLNLKWNNIGDQPVSLTVGRQDIMLGDAYDWWLVADGTPGDGSWTYFLDAARLNFEVKDIKTKFDLIYINQHAEADEWLPTLGHPRYANPPQYLGTDHPLNLQNEQGAVVYASNKSIKNTTVDGYFVYKRDRQEDFTKRGKFWTAIPGQDVDPGDNADIYTFGGKITGTPAEHLAYSMEGAYQFGTKEDTIRDGVGGALRFAERDIAAYGGKAKLSYLVKDRMNNQFSLGGEFLSGDDPNTKGKDEMFDLLWGCWPRWSELYIYSFGTETSGKIAQINNLGRFGPTWTLNPAKGLTFSATYNALFAPEEAASRAAAVPPSFEPRFSNNGHFRGHFLQTFLKYQLGKNIQAHLWAEFIWEGDYYARRDVLMFLRPEIMFTF